MEHKYTDTKMFLQSPSCVVEYSMFLTCSFCWLIADNSYGAAIHPGEPHHNVLGIVRRNLKEFAVIHNLRKNYR